MDLGVAFAVLSTIGWIGSGLFVIVYHHSSRWWEQGYGRALFLLGVVAFLFFTTSMLRNVLGNDYPGRNVMRSLNLVLGVCMVWYLLFTLVRGGAARRRERRQEERGVAGQPH